MKRQRARRQLTREEEALWRAVMVDVTPLFGKEFAEDLSLPPVSPPSKPQRLVKPQTTPASALKPQAPVVNPESAYQMNRGWERKLRRGTVGIEGRIDLHGMTREVAFTRLHRFLLDAITNEQRCLLVITGKGGRPGSDAQGILKTEIPRWLNHGPLESYILSVETAHPRDGGSGAYYVILRRQRQNAARRGMS